MASTNLRESIRADLLRYRKNTGWKAFGYAYIVYPGFRVTFWYRLVHYCHRSPKWRIFSKIGTLWLLHQQHRTGIELSHQTEIGPGVYIPHAGAIVINGKCKIGSNLYLSHDVLLGKAHAGPRQGVPTVGDDVYLGPGARLLGKLHVGDNAAIGANAVVLNDIPSDSFAVGAPAKVVKNTGARGLLGIAEEQATVQTPTKG